MEGLENPSSAATAASAAAAAAAAAARLPHTLIVCEFESGAKLGTRSSSLSVTDS